MSQGVMWVITGFLGHMPDFDAFYAALSSFILIWQSTVWTCGLNKARSHWQMAVRGCLMAGC